MEMMMIVGTFGKKKKIRRHVYKIYNKRGKLLIVWCLGE